MIMVGNVAFVDERKQTALMNKKRFFSAIYLLGNEEHDGKIGNSWRTTGS